MLLNDKDVLMDGEVGHIRVRLINKDGRYGTTALAYMGRVIDEKEKSRLLKLWNDINAFLRARAAQGNSKQEEEDGEE